MKDYPGHQVLGAPLATYRRLAVAMGLNPDVSVRTLAEEYLRLTGRPPVKPVLVDDAPCKENKFFGKDVDLFALPVPMVHGGDGGRYLGTWHIIVTKDPDTGAVNWGTYRTMVHNRYLVTGLIMPTSDAGKLFFQKYEPVGKPMPFALCIGNHPLVPFVGSAPLALPEPEVLGAMLGEPVRLVKCETCDLEVPADSEIVLEGEVLPNVRLPEGPFGEYVGYRTSPRLPRNVYLVKAVTFRSNPIFTLANMGMPTDEGQLIRSFTLALEMRKLLEREGIPVTDVYMYPESTHHLVVVGVKPLYSNIANQVACLLFGSKLAPWFYYIIVVEDDVDV